MKTNFIKRLLPLAFFFGMAGSAVGQAPAGMVLVSGTDFTAPGCDDSVYVGIDKIENSYLGILKPSISVNLPLTPNANVTPSTKKGTFVDGEYYAITNNPCKLDSFRLYDNEEEKWGLLLPKSSETATALNFKISGLAPGDFQVEVEYCFVGDYSTKWKYGYPGATLNTGSGMVEYGSLDPKIRVVANPDQYNRTSGPDVGFSTADKSGHGCATTTVTSKSSSSNPITDGSLEVNINMTQQTSAIFVTSIKVYAKIDPKIMGSSTACAGGESAVITASPTYTGVKYQWYKDGAPISGANKTSYSHMSGKTPGDHTYYYTVDVDGVEFKSEEFVVHDVLCCADEHGNPMSRKMIWQDDFGTFTSSSSYWVWDYSDISDPKKVTKSAAKPVGSANDGFTWRAELADPPQGANKFGIDGEGTYAVMANVNRGCSWVSMFGNGKYPNENSFPKGDGGFPFNPDHTYPDGSAYGGMLYINNGCNPGETLYSRKITGLCDRKLTLKCYLNNFSNSANPLDISIVVTDLTSGTVVKSDRVTRDASGKDGLGWKEVSVDVDLTGSDMQFEIISNVGGDSYNKLGNDMILDDIQIFACSSPSLDLYFDLDNFITKEVSCDGSLTGDNKPLMLMVNETEMIKTNFGGDQMYVYQYSKTPSVLESWKTIVGPTKSVTYEDLKSIVTSENLTTGDKIYFRAVLGTKTGLEEVKVYKPNEPCGSYSVSDTISLIIDCPSCTPPLDIKVKSDVEPKADKKIYLCKGESVTLSSNNIVPAESTWASKTFDGYTITWYEGSKSLGKSAVGTKLSSTASDLVITNDGVDAEEEHTYTVKAVDSEYPELALCQTEDEITVVFLKTPVIDPLTYEFCEGEPNDQLPLLKCTDCKLTYYATEADALAGENDVTVPGFETLKAADGPFTYYYTLTNEYDCVSEPKPVTITVNAIPEYTVEPIDPFCEGKAEEGKETLPTEVKAGAYSIAWTPNNTALNDLKGASTPYAYSYVVTDVATGCVAEAQDYSVTVNPGSTIKLTDTKECGVTTISETHTPSTAKLTYTLDGTEIAATSVFNFGDPVGELKVVADAEGCLSEDVITVEVYAVPDKPSTQDPTCYLKSQAASFKDIMKQCATPAASYDESAANNAGSVLVWRKKGETAWSTSAPVPTVKNASDPAEETITYEVALKNTTTECMGEIAEVTAHIYGAPVPDVTNAEYCLDATAAPFSERITVNNTIPNDYTLSVYADKAMTTKLDLSDVPSTAKAGVVSYYATQSSESGGESEPVEFTVTTYSVAEPIVSKTEFDYCKNVEAEFLSAEVNKKEASYIMSDGLKWSVDGGEYTALAPKPSTAEVGSTVYSVKQTYDILAAGFTATCEGTPVDITVNVSETTVPTGTLNVAYLYSELEVNGSFSDLLTKDSKVVDIESGYTYMYAECDASGAVSGSWSTTVPTPAPVNKSDLNGGSKTSYYAVKRIATSGAKCESDPVVITVTISDSPMPIVTPIYFCEGEEIPSLSEYVKISEANKPASKYELLWYGTKMPSISDMESGSTTVSSSPAATVEDANTINQMTYYVAQRDLDTKAIGAASALTITVYPKPVQTISSLATVCEKPVDLADAVSFKKAVPEATYATVYTNAAGDQIKSSVTESGIYNAQTAFNTPNATLSPSVCASSVDPIEITIETLDLTPVVDATTCPNTEAVLNAEITTNVASATFSWKAQGGIDGADLNSATGSSTFTTAPLSGEAGKTYKYDLVVTAGTCTESQSGIVITLGDGPVEGTLALSEANNTSTETYTSSRDVTARPFYMCGDGVDAVVDLKKDTDSEFEWVNAAGSKVGTGSSVKLSSAGTYTINYSNKCATSMTFKIEDASIKNNAVVLTSGTQKAAEGETLVVCEKSPMDFALSYTAASDESSVAWTKDGDATTVVSGKSASIASAKPEMSGTYTYVITNHGCSATGSVDAKVKPYIQFSVDPDKYVARRDSQLLIPTVITIPAAGEPSDIKWVDIHGMTVNTSKDFTYEVSEDNTFTITMSDDDYCEATATVSVKKDGRLQLETSIAEKMCRGDNGVYLTVDTTGTGKLIYDKFELTVVEKTANTEHKLSAFRKDNGKLLFDVNPVEDATYTVTITYRDGEGVDAQKVMSESSIIVLQPIRIFPPSKLEICSGEEMEVALDSVLPRGMVSVYWTADPTIVSGTDDTESITVVPEFDADNARNHKSTQTYHLVAKMEGCADKTEKVNVTVHEPIEGQLRDTIICEGFSTRLDASSYQATKYTWTSPMIGNPIGFQQTVSVTPEATTTYNVAMERGQCTAEAEVTVEVNSKPQIISVDSLSYRDVEIKLDDSYGTAPYYYAVDKGEFSLSSEIDSLPYNNHIAYVKDAVGCMDTLEFTIVPPAIKIPIWFSPNVDGDNDTWQVPGLSETYPDAEVSIFDRWGKLLVKYKGSDPGWDGIYNGNKMPSTDYWYEIHVREIDKIFTGHFTLIRR